VIRDKIIRIIIIIIDVLDVASRHCFTTFQPNGDMSFFLNHLVSWDFTGNVAGNWSNVHAPDDSTMIIDKGSRTVRRWTYPSDILSTRNTTGNNLGVKQGLRIENPMADRFRDWIIQCIFRHLASWNVSVTSGCVGTSLFRE
jgi:hypothetical protein